MDEEQYKRIIYGLPLKLKRLEEQLCEEKMWSSRKIRQSIWKDIRSLIKDYEE